MQAILSVMARTVGDIMNPHVLHVSESDPCDVIRAKLLRFGVSGAPVLDQSYRPVGFVSLRDLAGARIADIDELDDGDDNGTTVRATRPVVTTREDEPVESAARALAEADLRHFVVIDDAGLAVGVVSALDFVRALTGLPSLHPSRFEVDCSSAQAYPDNVDG